MSKELNNLPSGLSCNGVGMEGQESFSKYSIGMVVLRQNNSDNLKSYFWKSSVVDGTEKWGAVLDQSVLT